MSSYEELPWQKDRLDERKALFREMDPNGNGYLSLAEVDAVLSQNYTYGDCDMDHVNACMLTAFNFAKDFGGEDKTCGADYLENREFRIFLDKFIKQVQKVEEDIEDGELEPPFEY
eukprot:TRINITY_DN6022_c0_g1_i1.p3 TRINITY_DN6022_c0_g1~~TRINITY_DN6022_c0_g1_i1.p3  ORF type:complete len:116 (-),score=39.22 TRINITY_DN6022_c0_g1_i1:392-739(-)